MTEVFDSSDPKAIREAREKVKSKDQLAKDGLKVTMSNENGRAWLYRVLLACDPFRNCFSLDALEMARRCGEVNIGLQIIAEMQEVSPELYLQTMKENNK